MRAFLMQALTEIKIQLRRRETVVFSLHLPAFFLLFFGAVYGHARLQHIKIINLFLPGYAVLAVISVAFSAIATNVATERQYGIIKRLGGTPLPRSTFILAKVAWAVVLIIGVEIVLFVLATILYGAAPKGNPALIVLILLAGSLCFAAIGITFGGLIKPDSAAAAGTLAYLILAFLGGVFIPLQQFPESLRNAAGVLPSERLVDALQQVVTYGHGFSGHVQADLIGLAIWFAIAVAVGARRFHWT